MKIAFCFITIDNPTQPLVWDTFFELSLPLSFKIYCHAKHADNVRYPRFRDRIIPRHVPTRHGHISLVKATLELFSTAYWDDVENEYFVLLSESTVPIVAYRTLYNHLLNSRGKSFIRFRIPRAGSEHHRRLALVKNHRLLQPYFYHHDQWLILHRTHVERIIRQSFLAMFADMFAPDEHYFMNTMVYLLGIPISEIANRLTTFVNWRDREVKTLVHPTTGAILRRTIHPKKYESISELDLLEANSKGCWFFRKVSSDCDPTHLLTQFID